MSPEPLYILGAGMHPWGKWGNDFTEYGVAAAVAAEQVFDLVDRGGPQSIPLADLRAAHEGFFPKLMGSEITPEF